MSDMRGPNLTAPLEVVLGVYRRVSHRLPKPEALKALTHTVAGSPALQRVLPDEWAGRLRGLAGAAPLPAVITFEADAGTGEQPILMPDYSDLSGHTPSRPGAMQP